MSCCALILQANEKYKDQLFDTGIYKNQMHAQQWLVFYEKIEDCIKDIQDSNIQLANELLYAVTNL